MHKLSSLIENNDTVWFYCRTDYLAEQFLNQCEKEGFWALNNQKPTELFHHRFYGVFDNLSMGYLSNMIWCLTFCKDQDEHVRVDYEKYIFNEADYICHETNTVKYDFSDWNRIAYSNCLNHKKFYDQCEHFIEGQSFEEYNAYIYRYLVESSWHYTPKQTAQRMEWEEYFIAKSYLKHVPVAECSVEVGYGCG